MLTKFSGSPVWCFRGRAWWVFMTEDILCGFGLQDALTSGFRPNTAMDVLISAPPHCITSCVGVPSVSSGCRPVALWSPIPTYRVSRRKVKREEDQVWPGIQRRGAGGGLIMIYLIRYLCHGLSLLELTLHWTRYWPISPSHRSFFALPWPRSSIWVFPSCLKTFNWIYCYRELIVSIVVSAISVFRLVDNILSSILHG